MPARLGRALFLVALAHLALASEAAACAVCFGAPDSPMTAGLNHAILLLLGVIGGVQGGFIALFMALRKRATRSRAEGEGSRASEGGAR